LYTTFLSCSQTNFDVVKFYAPQTHFSHSDVRAPVQFVSLSLPHSIFRANKILSYRHSNVSDHKSHLKMMIVGDKKGRLRSDVSSVTLLSDFESPHASLENTFATRGEPLDE
jgi:hypothetical protein